MNGFERRRELKKGNILQAAAQLFQANGIEKVTVQEIAAKANVSYAIIFKYFISKDNLINEVMRWLYEQKYDLLESIVRSNHSFLERCNQLFLQNTKVLDIDPDIIDKANSNDSVVIYDIRSQYEAKSKELYRDFFEEGRREGYIHPDISVEAILLHRDAFRALIQTNPELFVQFKYNRQLFQDYMGVLWFGLMSKMEEPDDC
jgi:AcrR family transcriptional regulator